ncbi:hypothetical protein GGS23DRAFT_599229 [Durotheca rogersii]|uniref:uncharacterized protein n=1 Tax=Durotheca rogersii TaxID=419775 RepID=UPI00221E3EC8|nr:uncharacterized protein GGS23DRAFT_599229 [Durotheca rogersii]KAI5860709.1 hypothetical protein GGS23DRAFT_599229 [Durotheca rogersii]
MQRQETTIATWTVRLLQAQGVSQLIASGNRAALAPPALLDADGQKARSEGTPRFSASPSSPPERQPRQPIGRVTVTLGPQGHYILAHPERQPGAERPKPPRRRLSQGNLSDDSEASSTHTRPPSPHQQTTTSTSKSDTPEQHPALRISRQSHSAILYALEQTLRGPKQLTDDLVELYAPMSDLMGGRGGPATTNGNGASSVRPTTARAAVGSPSGIRGPRVIMQERAAREAAREARQREEQERERLEREHAANEARRQEEAVRREAERKDAEQRAAAATAAAAGAGIYESGVEPSTPRRPAQPTTSGRIPGDNDARASIPPRATSQAQASQQPRQARPAVSATQGAPGPSTSGPGMAGPSGTQPQPGESSTAIGRGRNSFPHAFERWETLSAHWEGLTSFWIRRLEQSAHEISQDPISAQLSRQVTDLSSAGANLFHAVVELQRLRASSERKFQRWFFETRAEIERSQEITAMLEAALEEERRSRADAIREAVEHEQGTSKMQKQLAELRKELTISKEEARRAWEELGRREQEERDRTTSLQLGHPTIVGGVQVVPMTQSLGRGNTQRTTRSQSQQEPSDYAQPQPSPAAARYQFPQVPTTQPTPGPAGGSTSFQAPSSVQHQQSYGSEGAYSEEEFEPQATQPNVYQPTGTSTQQPQYSTAPDYSGSGYTMPWEDADNRHHHPTRLSDVIEEEDERSRTSASQSQVSRP